jgi:quercetin dioxygenase-like cupin family protein
MEIRGAAPNPSQLEDASPTCYVGVVRFEQLSSPFADGLDVRLVEFDPGARSRPHASLSGRLLHVLSGEGVVAGPEGRIVIGPGDTVSVPAGEWHWHGGLPHSAVVVLLIERPADVSWAVALNDWPIGYA